MNQNELSKTEPTASVSASIPKAGPGNTPGITRVLAGVKLHHSLDEDYSVYTPASFVERFFANAIDYSLLGIAITLLEVPFTRILQRLAEQSSDGRAGSISLLIMIIALILLQIAPIVLCGQTLGKTFFGIRIIAEDNSAKLRIGQVLKREILGKSLSALILGIGYLMVLWSPDRRALHDKLCKTKVIKIRR